MSPVRVILIAVIIGIALAVIVANLLPSGDPARATIERHSLMKRVLPDEWPEPTPPLNS
jgi:hypothetical protein